MKRDMELIRRILFHLEKSDEMPKADAFEGSDPKYVVRHIGLTIDAGFVTGIEYTETTSGAMGILLQPAPRLTWAGHDFLDSARDEGVWKKVQQRAKKVSGTMAYAVLVELLKETTLQQLNLRP